ncbi:MAG TPA: hypothetical protein VGR56_07195 [Nitrososphaerales archaeon]|nr:hypothetical protein [Nitrososphaerales archaeon]
MNARLDLEGMDLERTRGNVYECPSCSYALWVGEGVDKLVGEKMKRRLGNVLIVAHQVKMHGRPRPHW